MAADRGTFDKSKDKMLHEQIAFKKDDTTDISVSVWRYGEGDRKIQISRRRKDTFSGDMMFAKLGRMTYEEFVAVARAVKEIKDRGGIL